MTDKIDAEAGEEKFIKNLINYLWKKELKVLALYLAEVEEVFQYAHQARLI